MEMCLQITPAPLSRALMPTEVSVSSLCPTIKLLETDTAWTGDGRRGTRQRLNCRGPVLGLSELHQARDAKIMKKIMM